MEYSLEEDDPVASSSAQPYDATPGAPRDVLEEAQIIDVVPETAHELSTDAPYETQRGDYHIVDEVSEASVPTPEMAADSAWAAAQVVAATAVESIDVVRETLGSSVSATSEEILGATSVPSTTEQAPLLGAISSVAKTVSAGPSALVEAVTKQSKLVTPPSKPASRIWGHVTSSVDWCESNYQWTEWIAEFWNTVSSFFMVAAGYLGRQHMVRKDPGTWDPVLEMPSACGLDRVWWTWVMLEVVGWGSVAFHANLKWWSQAFDEVPMVWTSCMMLTTLLTARFQSLPVPQPPPAPSISFKPVPKETTLDWLQGMMIEVFLPRQTLLATQPAITSILSPILAQYALMCTALITIFRGPTQFLIFHVLFGLIQWTCFVFLCLIVIDAELGNPQSGPPRRGMGKDTYGKLLRAHKFTVRKLFLAGCGSYGVAMLIWLTDFKLCSSIQKRWWINPQGHAIWHLLVSIGFYYLHTLAVYDRLLAAYRTNDNLMQEGLLTLFSDLQKNSPNYLKDPISSPALGAVPTWPPPLPTTTLSAGLATATGGSSAQSENGEDGKDGAAESMATDPSNAAPKSNANGRPLSPLKMKKASRGDAPEVVWLNDWLPVVRIRREEKKRR